MTTDIKAWIDEHRAIHKAATEGPWRASLLDGLEHDDGSSNYRGGLYPDERGSAPIFVTPNIDKRNATAIVDAHNVTVPTALSMVEAVLELHVLNLDFDGTPYCKGCSIPYEVTTTWPCPTVRALEGGDRR